MGPGIPTLSNKLGSPTRRSPRAFFVALSRRVLRTPVGVKEGSSSSNNAVAPAAKGAAIEVPLMVKLSVSYWWCAETMLWPGAKMAMQVPKLLKEARVSVEVDAPTPIAEAMKE